MWLDHVVAQRAARAACTGMSVVGHIGNALYRLHAGRRQSIALATNSR